MRQATLLVTVLGILLTSTAVALEPGDTLWTRTYGGRDYECARSTQETDDGGFIVGGATYAAGPTGVDVYILKLDANGDTLWTRTYGDSAEEVTRCIEQTTDGGYAVMGRYYISSENNYDFYVMKLDANGDTLWTRRYDNTGKTDDGEFGQQTADGGYIIVGETYIYWGDYNIWLVKTDVNGDTLWTHTYDLNGFDFTQCVAQTADGGYIITGATGTIFGTGFDLYLLKTDANGDSLWMRTYGGSDYDYGYSVQQTTDGGYIVAGGTVSFGAGDYDFYLVKTDADGDTLWTRTYGCPESDYAHSLRQTTDGGYILAGYSECFGNGDRDFWLVKTDSNGDTLWTRNYAGKVPVDSEIPFSVQQTTDGGYIVAGMTSTGGVNTDDVYLVRIAGEQPEPEVSIELVPDDPPVTVPPGGSFGFTGTLTNNTEETQVTDVWIMAEVPGIGRYGPLRRFNDVPLSPYQVISRHLNQSVPNYAPLGNYLYLAYCGDYPSTVVDSSYFPFEVTSGAVTKAGNGGWILTGSFLEADPADLPSEFGLLSNYPNPFNAGTVISYQLPLTGHVTLEIYNLCGEKLETLVDNEQDAGYKSISWDASEVSSGVYFYKLTAGDFSETKRMMLVK